MSFGNFYTLVMLALLIGGFFTYILRPNIWAPRMMKAGAAMVVLGVFLMLVT